MGHECHLVNVSEEFTSEASAGIEPNGVVVHGEPFVVLLGVNSETARVLNSSLILCIPIVEPLVVLLLLDDWAWPASRGRLGQQDRKSVV